MTVPGLFTSNVRTSTIRAVTPRAGAGTGAAAAAAAALGGAVTAAARFGAGNCVQIAWHRASRLRLY
jgi:hypothetical protein